MKKLITILSLVLAFSCTDNTENPYSVFDNSNVTVTVGESFKVDLENYYDDIAPTYTLKKNNESTINITDSSFVLRPGYGYSGPKDLNWEQVTITLEFNPSDFYKGDILILTSHNGAIELSKIFEVL